MVEHRRSKKLFALKYIDKAQCSKQRAVANVIQERRLLEEVSYKVLALNSVTDCFGSGFVGFPVILAEPHQIDHPFIVNMRYAFQDDGNCFFVLDLMLGGDLRCEYPFAFVP